MQENPAEEKPEEEEKPEPVQEDLVKPKKSKTSKCGIATAVGCLGCCAFIIFGMLRNATVEVEADDYGVYDDGYYDDVNNQNDLDLSLLNDGQTAANLIE